MSLVVVGSVAFDTLETPAGKVCRVLGGSAVYFSLAARFRSAVTLVSTVGADCTEQHLSPLRHPNINTKFIERSAQKTFYWHGRYSEDFKAVETLESEIGVLENFRPDLKDKHLSGDILFLANTDPDLQLQILSEVPHRWSFCDTMDIWIKNKKDKVRQVFERVTGLIINQGEAQLFTEKANVLAGVQTLSALGPQIILIKKAEDGALLFMNREFYPFSAYPITHVHDPTGAGDSFAGGFLSSLDQAKESLDLPAVKKAVAWGSIIASFTCEAFGTQRLQTLTEEEIHQRYQNYLNRVHIPSEVENPP